MSFELMSMNRVVTVFEELAASVQELFAAANRYMIYYLQLTSGSLCFQDWK